MSDLPVEIEDEELDEDMQQMVAFFNSHTALGKNHILMVTIYDQCEECGGTCENGNNMVGTFSSLERVWDWLASFDEIPNHTIELMVLDDPDFGTCADVGEMH